MGEITPGGKIKMTDNTALVKRDTSLGQTRPHKFHQDLICKLIAAGFGDRWISNYLYEEYDISVAPTNVWHTYRKGKKWQNLILHYMKNDNDWKSHPLSRKKNRLDIISRAIDQSLLIRTERRFDKTGAEILTKSYDEAGNVAPLIREARSEAEGENIPQQVVIVFGHRKSAPVDVAPEAKPGDLPDDKEEKNVEPASSEPGSDAPSDSGGTGSESGK